MLNNFWKKDALEQFNAIDRIVSGMFDSSTITRQRNNEGYDELRCPCPCCQAVNTQDASLVFILKDEVTAKCHKENCTYSQIYPALGILHRKKQSTLEKQDTENYKEEKIQEARTEFLKAHAYRHSTIQQNAYTNKKELKLKAEYPLVIDAQGNLLIAAYKNKKIQYVQKRSPDGKGIFALIKHTSSTGTYTPFDADNADAQIIYICESVTNAEKIHLATNCTAISTNGAVRMCEAVKNVRKDYPNETIELVLDNDSAGLKAGLDVLAQDENYTVHLPHEKDVDAWDVWKKSGDEGLRAMLSRTISKEDIKKLYTSEAYGGKHYPPKSDFSSLEKKEHTFKEKVEAFNKHLVYIADVPDTQGHFYHTKKRVYLTDKKIIGELERREKITLTKKDIQAFHNKYDGCGLLYADTIMYKPIDEPFFSEGATIYYNLYKKYDGEVREGDVTKFLDHIKYLLPKEREHNWFLQWMAHIVQKPYIKMHLAPFLMGKQGTGKSYVKEVLSMVLINILYKIANFADVSEEDFMDSFNEWVAFAHFIAVEEVAIEGRVVRRKLKRIITNKTIRVNIKNQSAFFQDNAMNFLFITNDKSDIEVLPGDRRPVILDSPAKKRSKGYYRDLFSWTAKNIPAIRHFLENLDISDFDPFSAFHTDAKDERIEGSCSEIQQDILSLKENQGTGLHEVDLLSNKGILHALNYGQKTDQRLNGTKGFAKEIIGLEHVELGHVTWYLPVLVHGKPEKRRVNTRLRVIGDEATLEKWQAHKQDGTHVRHANVYILQKLKEGLELTKENAHCDERDRMTVFLLENFLPKTLQADLYGETIKLDVDGIDKRIGKEPEPTPDKPPADTHERAQDEGQPNDEPEGKAHCHTVGSDAQNTDRACSSTTDKPPYDIFKDAIW